MSYNEKVIQESYTKALKKAKENPENIKIGVTNKQNADIVLDVTQTENQCCTPTGSITQESPDQQVSFGCIRLNDFLENNLTSGDTVIDFGSGPGHDLFMAARIVGKNGRAIGVDFTDAMIEEASSVAKEQGLTQVELVKASIDSIPLEDNIADFIISNCVINLTYDKQKVFDEAFRLLKPGGILIDADVISDRPLSNNVQDNKELWCSCVGGALTKSTYEEQLEKAGFVDIKTELGNKQNITFEATEFGIYSGVIFAKKP